MTRSLGLRIVFSSLLAVGALACKEEGGAEKAGRKFDEAIDKLRHGDEGAVEKAGRKMDEALDDAEEEIHDLRKQAADAIEGDD